MSDELPAPIAEGTLLRTPFAHVLLYVLQHGLNGTLVVWPEPDRFGQRPGGQDRIRVVNGIPVAGRLLQSSSSFDRGLLPLFVRVDAPYAFYELDLVGDGPDMLRGDINPIALIAASLRGAAREDAIEEVLNRLGFTPMRVRAGVELTRYGFDEHERALISYLRASPGKVSDQIESSGDKRATRRLVYLLTITKALEPVTVSAAPAAFGDLPVPEERGRPPSDPRMLASARPGSDPRLAAASGRPGSDPRLAAASGRPGSDPRLSAVTGSSNPPRSAREVEISDHGSQPPRERPRKFSLIPTPPEPRGELNDEQRQIWEELGKKARVIEQQNYFEMLSVPKDAPIATVQDAYYKLVKKWHPDRLPPELGEIRPWADRVFYYLTKAKDQLSDEKTRGEYIQSVQHGGGTPESDRKVNSIVSAALEFQKAEVLFRRRDYDGAAEKLDDAKHLNPDEADFYAFEAWLLFHQFTDANSPYDRMLQAVDRAIKLRPIHEKAHYYKAMILKRRGDEGGALALFKRVMELNPRNVDAEREVRIATMRGGKSGLRKSGEGGDGLFSKLFTGKKEAGNNKKK
jgi:curved DNA-binding protein CbpA